MPILFFIIKKKKKKNLNYYIPRLSRLRFIRVKNQSESDLNTKQLKSINQIRIRVPQLKKIVPNRTVSRIRELTQHSIRNSIYIFFCLVFPHIIHKTSSSQNKNTEKPNKNIKSTFPHTTILTINFNSFYSKSQERVKTYSIK